MVVGKTFCGLTMACQGVQGVGRAWRRCRCFGSMVQKGKFFWAAMPGGFGQRIEQGGFANV